MRLPDRPGWVLYSTFQTCCKNPVGLTHLFHKTTRRYIRRRGGLNFADTRANIVSVYGRRQMQYGERERPGPRNRITPRGSGRSRSPYCTVHPSDNRSKARYFFTDPAKISCALPALSSVG